MWCPSADRTACWRKSGNTRCWRNRCWLLRGRDDCTCSLIAVKIEVYGSDAAGSAQEPIPWGLYDWVSASSPHLCSLQRLWKISIFRAAFLDLCVVIKSLQPSLLEDTGLVKFAAGNPSLILEFTRHHTITKGGEKWLIFLVKSCFEKTNWKMSPLLLLWQPWPLRRL